MADAEIAVVLRLIASQFQSELRKSGGMLGDFGKVLTDYRVVIGAVGTALFATAKATGEHAEQLLKQAQAFGTSTEKMSAYQYAAKLANVSNEQLSTSFTHLIKNAKEMGLEFSSTDELIAKVSQKFRAMPDGPEKMALALQLLGKSAKDTLGFFTSDLQASENELRKMGGLMSEEAAVKAAAFDDKLDKLNAQLLVMRNNLGNVVIPALSGFIDWVGRAIDKVSTFQIGTDAWVERVRQNQARVAALNQQERVNSGAASMFGPGGEKLPPGWAPTGAAPAAGGGGPDEFLKQKLWGQLALGSVIVEMTKRQNKEREEAIELFGREAEAERELALVRLEAQKLVADPAVLKKFYEDEEQAFIQSRLKQVSVEFKAKAKLAELNEQYIDQRSRDEEGFFDSLNRGLQDYTKNHAQTFNLATDVVRGAAQAMNQGLKQFFLDPAKFNLQSLLSFAHNVVADIASRMVSAGLIRAAAGFFAPSPTPTESSGVPFGMQPIHGQYGAAFDVPGVGGPDSKFIGLMTTPGERVTIETPEQQRARGGGGMIVNIYNQTPAQVQTQSRTGAGGENIMDIVIRAVDQALSSGSYDRTLGTNFGIRRQGFAR